MAYMKIGAAAAGGTIGVLSLGTLVTNAMNSGLVWLFGAGVVIFVLAGAVALVLRAM